MWHKNSLLCKIKCKVKNVLCIKIWKHGFALKNKINKLSRNIYNLRFASSFLFRWWARKILHILTKKGIKRDLHHISLSIWIFIHFILKILRLKTICLKCICSEKLITLNIKLQTMYIFNPYEFVKY